jgi:PiT family inorganic phosphate transporter
MLTDAYKIHFGLLLFGSKLIRMVGSQITKLNSMHAYCVSLSAALTGIVASWQGLPVSSTYNAAGAILPALWRWTVPKADCAAQPSPTHRKRPQRPRQRHLLALSRAQDHLDDVGREQRQAQGAGHVGRLNLLAFGKLAITAK